MVPVLPARPGPPRAARRAKPPPPQVPSPDAWDRGGDEPPGPTLDAARVGVVVFLVAEAMLFAGFIAAFLVVRLGSAAWPPPGEPRLPVGVTAVNTAVLVLSGLAMRGAVAARRRGDDLRFRRHLEGALLGGAAFLAVQGFEWARLVRFGLTATASVYGASFYALVGIHAAHVVGALGWLAGLRVQARGGRPGEGAVAAGGLYWGFVVLLWPVLWILAYLW
jgi:heme/copper-type cytochrome/quinol oxidase subunit 3